MTQKQNYHIRAEYVNGDKWDFVVGAETLEAARARAEVMIRTDSAMMNQPPKIDWRGQVAFVNCKPIEETVP